MIIKFSYIIISQNNGISDGLVVTIYTKRLGLHFSKELTTEREFGNVV